MLIKNIMIGVDAIKELDSVLVKYHLASDDRDKTFFRGQIVAYSNILGYDAYELMEKYNTTKA